MIFGKDVSDVAPGQSISLSGGGDGFDGVHGFPTAVNLQSTMRTVTIDRTKDTGLALTLATKLTSRGGPRAQLDPAHVLVARAGDPLPPASAPAAERDKFVDQRERVVVGAGLERGHCRPRARGFRRGEGE